VTTADWGGMSLDVMKATVSRRELLLRGTSALAVSMPLASALARTQTATAARSTSSCVVGAFANPANARLTFAEAQRVIAAREQLIGQPLRIVSTFVAWEEPFPNEGHALDRDAGRAPLIAWDGRTDLAAIAAGRHDALLRARAHACREFAAPIYIRWAAEFNGEWNPCYGRARGFVAAWRHIVRTFRDAGAANVRFVWCPFAVVGRPRAHEEWGRYYPGDRYVDWVGMDGYNWGSARTWSRWHTFREIFQPLYEDYARRRPLMICEIGSTELGGDKAAWIHDMGARLMREFARVRAVVWFDTNKETDWRIDSSEASLHAFRTVVGHPRYRGAVLGPAARRA
jgi:hypothetical protein